MSPPYNIYSTGDYAVTISFGDTIDIVTHEKVVALFKQLTTMQVTGVRDIIPAYTTLTIIYDILEIKRQTNFLPVTFLKQKIEEALTKVVVAKEEKRVINIPVCYGIFFGADLERIALIKNISIDEIIQLHTSKQYRVYMLGFLPGFAYMGSVDERIATPRLATPRQNVTAGSVGIAGSQTGIYPLDSPGGWNIVGRTPLQMFNAKHNDPCFLKPGDIVQFVSIKKDEFEYLKNKHEYSNY